MSRFSDRHQNSYYKRTSPQIEKQVPSTRERILPQNLCKECPRDRVNDPCGDCRISDLEDFRKIREFLQNNPRSNPVEVANATKISISRILRLIG